MLRKFFCAAILPLCACSADNIAQPASVPSSNNLYQYSQTKILSPIIKAGFEANAIPVVGSGRYIGSNMTVCAAANEIFTDNISLPISCVDSDARVTIVVRRDDPTYLLSAFIDAVKATGGSVAYQNERLNIKAGSADAISTEVVADDEAAIMTVNPETLADSETFTAMLIAERSYKYYQHSASMVRSIISNVSLDAEIVDYGDVGVLVFASENDLQRISSLLSIAEDGQFTVPVADMSSERLSFYQMNCYSCDVQYSSSDNMLYATGPTDSLSKLSNVVRRMESRKANAQVSAVVFLYSDSDIMKLDASLGAVVSNRRPNVGLTTVPFQNSGANIQLAVEQAQKNGVISVISRPVMAASLGEVMRVSSGDEVPVQTAYDAESGQSTVEYIQSGLDATFKVTATSKRAYSVDVHVTIREQNGLIDGRPIFKNRKHDTVVEMLDGQTIFVGGITTNINESEKGITGFLPSVRRVDNKTQLGMYITLQ